MNYFGLRRCLIRKQVDILESASPSCKWRSAEAKVARRTAVAPPNDVRSYSVVLVGLVSAEDDARLHEASDVFQPQC